jgi:predicted nucleic acid-binding protein
MHLWVLDTDVLSAMFKHQLPSPLFSRLSKRPLAITYVQVGELVQWFVSSNWGLARIDEMRSWMKQFPVIHSDAAIAETWGEISSYSRKRGRPTPVNDSWIAACCIRHGLPLVTFNNRDFADFAEFEGLQLIS